jgi:GDP-4-dehydro-6-deoxy-D-mannose reductase
VRALVTGGAGFAGRHLLAALDRGGHEVVGAGLPDGGLPEHGDWRDLDVRSEAACRELLAELQPGWVFHLAGQAHVARAEADPLGCLAVNFGGTRALLEACLAAAPRPRIVLVSSAEVYGRVRPEDLPVTESQPLRPATAYAVSKAAAEMAAHHAAARGLSVVILRPFNHIGPGQSDDFVASAFARQIARIEAGRQEPVLRVGNLAAVRDLLDVRDAVQGYARAAEAGRDGATYNVTSGDAVAVRDLLETLLSLTEARVSVLPDPARMRPVDVPVFHGSAERLAADTGFRARLDLRRTLSDVLDYWRARESTSVERR